MVNRQTNLSTINSVRNSMIDFSFTKKLDFPFTKKLSIKANPSLKHFISNFEKAKTTHNSGKNTHLASQILPLDKIENNNYHLNMGTFTMIMNDKRQ